MIARCLERDPKRRLRDIGDARLELETIDASAVAATSETPSSTNRRFSVRGWRLVAVGVMLVAATAALTSWIDRMTARETSASAATVRLTSDDGLTTDPALSPDGRAPGGLRVRSRGQRQPGSLGSIDRRRRAAAFDLRPR